MINTQTDETNSTVYQTDFSECSKSIKADYPIPPKFMRYSRILVNIYYWNYEWKSVIARCCVVCYMSVIFWILFKKSNPWYEFFYYLTLQGWTLELLYFSFSLYLDILARWYGSQQCISKMSKAAVQILSELVFATQVVIVLFFWIIVYPQESWRNIWWELNCHGAGLALIAIDYLYRITGFSLRHNRYIVVFALSYSLFHYYVVVYCGKQIYPGIDFKSVRSFTVFLIGFSTVIFTHKIFYLISNWKWIKEDIKSLIGIVNVILVRQNSFDLLVHGVPEFGSELLSIPPNRNDHPSKKKKSS